jgi:hypothetical protein
MFAPITRFLETQINTIAVFWVVTPCSLADRNDLQDNTHIREDSDLVGIRLEYLRPHT